MPALVRSTVADLNSLQSEDRRLVLELLSRSNDPDYLQYVWALFAPDLGEPIPGSPIPDHIPKNWLLNLAKRHKDKFEALAIASSNLPTQKTRRIGIMHERRLKYFFEQSREIEVLKFREQVQGVEETRGEIDFILRDSDKKAHQLEVAVKLYLAEKQPSKPLAWKHFIGPNSKDRMDLKIDRTIRHSLQLPLPFPVDIRHHQMQGRLFYRWEDYPLNIHTHLKGFWCHHSALEKFPFSSEGDLFHIPFPYWHSPYDRMPLTRLSSRGECVKHAAQFVAVGERAEMYLACFRLADQKYIERPLMVVPDRWPQFDS